MRKDQDVSPDLFAAICSIYIELEFVEVAPSNLETLTLLQ